MLLFIKTQHTDILGSHAFHFEKGYTSLVSSKSHQILSDLTVTEQQEKQELPSCQEKSDDDAYLLEVGHVHFFSLFANILDAASSSLYFLAFIPSEVVYNNHQEDEDK